MGKRAAIYCRISDDRAGGGLGVARQEADCRKVADAQDLDVVEVLVDNDLSAYKGKARPAYKALLNAASSHDIEVILAWHPDRLHRSPVELEEFISICDRNDLQVITVQSGHIDLSTASGRMVARMLGSAARYESEHKAERQRRKALELAKAGKFAGGGTRPFGFENDFKTIRPDEAEILRDIAARFLAGETIGSLCRWLQSEHITSSKGSYWSPMSLRRMLRSARISGQRAHLDEIVAKAEWDPIITPDQTARIRAILDDPKRKHLRSPRRYLLSGTMLRCHSCDGRMSGRPNEDGTRRYICSSGPSYNGCGKTFIVAQPTEELITRAVLMRLDSPAMEQVLTGRQQLDGTGSWQEVNDQARAELDELADLKGRRVISTAEWLAARAPIVDRLDQARVSLSRSTQHDLLRDLSGKGEALGRQWPDLPLSRQRAVVAAVLDHAIVGPGRRGFNQFDPNRITPIWLA